jgi:hypothetical protein
MIADVKGGTVPQSTARSIVDLSSIADVPLFGGAERPNRVLNEARKVRGKLAIEYGCVNPRRELLDEIEAPALSIASGTVTVLEFKPGETAGSVEEVVH